MNDVRRLKINLDSPRGQIYDLIIYWPGRSLSKELAKNVLAVLKELQCGCELEVVWELKEILEMEKHNILITPALVVNGHILCEGHIWTKDHIKHFLEKAAEGGG